jgi:2-iminobutanoate/2-iminopropanoate deaminase
MSRPSVIPFTALGLPVPGGHYSHATLAGGMVFVSGQLGVRPDGSHTADQPFAVQARQTLANLMVILQAAGCRPADVAKVTVFIVGMEHWADFNVVYAEIFGDARPARSVVPVNPLHFGYLLEVEAIAFAPHAAG